MDGFHGFLGFGLNGFDDMIYIYMHGLQVTFLIHLCWATTIEPPSVQSKALDSIQLGSCLGAWRALEHPAAAMARHLDGSVIGLSSPLAVWGTTEGKWKILEGNGIIPSVSSLLGRISTSPFCKASWAGESCVLGLGPLISPDFTSFLLGFRFINIYPKLGHVFHFQSLPPSQPQLWSSRWRRPLRVDHTCPASSNSKSATV